MRRTSTAMLIGLGLAVIASCGGGGDESDDGDASEAGGPAYLRSQQIADIISDADLGCSRYNDFLDRRTGLRDSGQCDSRRIRISVYDPGPHLDEALESARSTREPCARDDVGLIHGQNWLAVVLLGDREVEQFTEALGGTGALLTCEDGQVVDG